MVKEIKIDEKIELDMAHINNILSSLDENFQFMGVTFGRNIEKIYTFKSDNKMNKYYIIGNDFGKKIAVEIKTLEVFWLASKYFRKFINSSLETFLDYMKIVNKVNREMNPNNGDLQDDEKEKIKQQIITKMNKTDQKALANNETWWQEKFEFDITLVVNWKGHTRDFI